MGQHNHVLHDAHDAPVWVKISPFLAMLTGFIMALWFYVWDKKKPAQCAFTLDPVYKLLLNKLFFFKFTTLYSFLERELLVAFFGKKVTVG